MIRTRLQISHCFGCAAVADAYLSVSRRWRFNGNSQWRESDGKECSSETIRSERWHELKCVNRNCPALLLVNENDLLDATISTPIGA